MNKVRAHKKRIEQLRYPKRIRKNKAQPLSFHKEKWLARLSCSTARVVLSQVVVARESKKCIAYLRVYSKGVHLLTDKSSGRVEHLNRKPLPFNAKIFRALDALAAEGKIQTSMPYTEWCTQVALGTTNKRTFYKNKSEDMAL